MDNIRYLVTLSWLCFLLIIILCDVLIDRRFNFFYLRSDGEYILVSDNIMAVFLLIIILWLILIDSDSSFLLKVRWKIYYTWWRCHGCFLFFIIILCEILIDSDSSFLLNVRWAIYFTWLHCHGCVFSLLLYCVTFWYTAIALFYLRSYGKYILIGDAVMAVSFYYHALLRSGRQWAFFSTKG